MNRGEYDLRKTVYDNRQAKEILDEEFTEFIIKKYSVKEFFTLFYENFYDIKIRDIIKIYNQSIKHIGGYVDPRDEIISDLEEEKQRIETQIASIERNHPYFKNGELLMDAQHQGNANETTGRISAPRFLMHSGKKRRIVWDYSVFGAIKTRLGLSDNRDDKIHLFLTTAALNTIPTGPQISSIGDMFISNYDVNIYAG